MYYMSFFAFCRKLKLGENKWKLCYFVININKFLIVLLINKRYNLEKRRWLNEKENINFYNIVLADVFVHKRIERQGEKIRH